MNLSLPTSESLQKDIETRLSVLDPTSYILADETHKHLKHPGHQQGTYHYHLTIASPQLNSLDSTIDKHRRIYELLAPVQQWIHSIRITVK